MARKKKAQLRFALEHDPGPGRLQGVVKQEGGGLAIYVKGYGNAAADPSPVAALVFQDGRLRLLSFPNYENPEPMTIELEGAAEPRT
jgi:hypothetical protein